MHHSSNHHLSLSSLSVSHTTHTHAHTHKQTHTHTIIGSTQHCWHCEASSERDPWHSHCSDSPRRLLWQPHLCHQDPALHVKRGSDSQVCGDCRMHRYKNYNRLGDVNAVDWNGVVQQHLHLVSLLSGVAVIASLRWRNPPELRGHYKGVLHVCIPGG